MINRFFHVGTGAAVQFESNPLRGNGDLAQRHQSAGYDSNGSTYVYSKNSTKHHEAPLVYPHQSTAVLIDLVTFIQARNGDKTAFTWYDHDGVAHTVWFTSGRLKYNETEPGKYRLEVRLTEDKP